MKRPIMADNKKMEWFPCWCAKQKPAEPFWDRVYNRLCLKHNFYFWQTNSQHYNVPGFSYDIPKEEQIRSAVYAEICPICYDVELEWNLYVTEGRSDDYDGRDNARIGEIDLVCFPKTDKNKQKIIFMEIKRFSYLSTWNRKEKDIWVKGIVPDHRKLALVKQEFKKNRKISQFVNNQIKWKDLDCSMEADFISLVVTFEDDDNLKFDWKKINPESGYVELDINKEGIQLPSMINFNDDVVPVKNMKFWISTISN